MSSQVTITQLPQALALQGTEAVPIVQNGVTVQTTVGAISGAGALNYPFLTVGSTSGLTQARYISAGSGLSLADNGAGGSLQINMTGAALSLNSSPTGIQVKTGSNTLTGRTLGVGSGLSIANGDGMAGNPVISLGTSLANVAALSGTGLLTINGTNFSQVTLLGTSGQIAVANGNASGGSPTFSLVSTSVTPGTYSSATFTVDAYGRLTFASSGTAGGVTFFSGGTTGLTPSTPTVGSITLAGVLVASNGGTGASTLTGYVKGNGTSAMTASTTVPTTDLSGTITNAQLANSAITINGSAVSLGSSISVGTVTAVTGTSPVVSSGGATPAISMPAATTSVSGYLTSTDWNTFNSKGAGSVTSVSGTGTVNGLTLTGTVTTSGSLTLGGTLSGVANSALTNSSITINGSSVSLGGSTSVGTVTSVAALTLGTTGTDLSSTVANSTTTPVITLNVPTASATNRGALSSADWTTFNNKQPAGTYVTSVSGTTGRITSTGGTNPVLDLTSGVATPGTTGSATLIPVVTIDTYGRVTSITTAANPQGTVTSVSGTGTVNGITLTGTVTTAGSLTLGGTLDLSSPPAIGSTTASTGRFTTVTSTVATGTAPFTVASTTAVANLSIGGNAGTVTNGVYTTDTGTVTNTMLAGSIANAKLTNSSITFGSTAQALGSTVSAISGVTIDNGAIGGTTPAAGTFTTLVGGGGSANYGQLTGGATTKAVQFQTLGSDANISQVFQSKGTGAIDLAAGTSGVNISNGGTVTAITRTAAGVSYTSPPAVAISAPTTAGGVQATATCTVSLQTIAVTAGGSGYSVNDVLTLVGGTGTAATVTVATLSGSAVATVNITTTGAYSVIPTNPISVTGGTGTGATFTASSYAISSTVTITNAGSGYVEQPTVTFSGGGGSGAAAYATVGGPTNIKCIGSQLGFQTSMGTGFAIQNYGTSNTTNYYVSFASATGNSAILEPRGDASVDAVLSSRGTGSVRFVTNGFSLSTGFEQLRVAHTASAVNYVQVTGAATGGTVNISSQGSDAGIPLVLQAKASLIRFLTGNGFENFRVNSVNSSANYLAASGAIAGASPFFAAQGTDTNIDLALTPKGTGKVVITNGIQGGTF